MNLDNPRVINGPVDTPAGPGILLDLSNRQALVFVDKKLQAFPEQDVKGVQA